jgi:hypothetical protein
MIIEAGGKPVDGGYLLLSMQEMNQLLWKCLKQAM